MQREQLEVLQRGGWLMFAIIHSPMIHDYDANIKKCNGTSMVLQSPPKSFLFNAMQRYSGSYIPQKQTNAKMYFKHHNLFNATVLWIIHPRNTSTIHPIRTIKWNGTSITNKIISHRCNATLDHTPYRNTSITHNQPLPTFQRVPTSAAWDQQYQGILGRIQVNEEDW